VSAIGKVFDQLRLNLSTSEADVRIVGARRAEVSGATANSGRRIGIYARDDFDFDVAFHVPEKLGTPFEQVFCGTPDEAEEVQATVVQFVVDLVRERIVLSMDNHPLKGGRRFVPSSELTETALKKLSWAVSWRGTHDSEANTIQQAP
jgi:hypothetical protein